MDDDGLQGGARPEKRRAATLAVERMTSTSRSKKHAKLAKATDALPPVPAPRKNVPKRPAGKKEAEEEKKEEAEEEKKEKTGEEKKEEAEEEKKEEAEEEKKEEAEEEKKEEAEEEKKEEAEEEKKEEAEEEKKEEEEEGGGEVKATKALPVPAPRTRAPTPAINLKNPKQEPVDESAVAQVDVISEKLATAKLHDHMPRTPLKREDTCDETVEAPRGGDDHKLQMVYPHATSYDLLDGLHDGGAEHNNNTRDDGCYDADAVLTEKEEVVNKCTRDKMEKPEPNADASMNTSSLAESPPHTLEELQQQLISAAKDKVAQRGAGDGRIAIINIISTVSGVPDFGTPIVDGELHGCAVRSPEVGVGVIKAIEEALQREGAAYRIMMSRSNAAASVLAVFGNKAAASRACSTGLQTTTTRIFFSYIRRRNLQLPVVPHSFRLQNLPPGIGKRELEFIFIPINKRVEISSEPHESFADVFFPTAKYAQRAIRVAHGCVLRGCQMYATQIPSTHDW